MAIGRTVLVATDRLGRTWRIEQPAARRVRVECAGAEVGVCDTVDAVWRLVVELGGPAPDAFRPG
jgi:hypothetical protein